MFPSILMKLKEVNDKKDKQYSYIVIIIFILRQQFNSYLISENG